MKKFIFIFIFFCQTLLAHKVLISNPAYEEIVKKLDPELEVINLIPPDIDPHIYEVTLKQTNILKEIDIWFCIGETFEKRIKDHFPQNKIVDLRQNLSLLPSNISFEMQDKHIWLSPKLLLEQINTMHASLVLLRPEKKILLNANKEKLILEIKKLEEELQQILRPLKGSSIIVSHPSLTYFCHDYHLKQISIESSNENSFKKLNDLLNQAKQKEVILIIGQPQHSNKIATFIAEKTNKPFITIDPYQKNIFNNLKNIAQKIASPDESN